MKSIFEKGKKIDFDTNYVIWGTGRKCEELLNLCKENIRVQYCVDSDMQKVNGMIQGLPIYHFSKIFDDKKENWKIIIASQAYLKIKEILLENGVCEDDIFVYSEWEVFYSWFKLKKIILPTISITTGNVCNLKCKGCIAYIPYSKNRKNLKFSNIVDTIDTFFKIVDYVESVYFGGGEAFLNNDFVKVMEYFCTTYKRKFGKVYVNTNGTVMPKEENFHFYSMYNLNFIVSDYNKTVLGGHIELVKKLKKYNIPYIIQEDFIRDNKMGYWYDMGDPNIIQKKTEKELKELFSKCITNCRILYDNKLWYCYSMVMAELGLGIPMELTDYCDMKKIDKNNEKDIDNFLRNFLGYPVKGYYSMCDRCNGMGAYVNNKFIPVAEQID